MNKKIALNPPMCDPQQNQLHDITTLVAHLRNLQAQYNMVFKEESVRRELKRLENWADNEHQGEMPENIISENGLAWLVALRDQLKLSADEIQRLESEGGSVRNKEQTEKTEELLKTVRRIDKIIDESCLVEVH